MTPRELPETTRDSPKSPSPWNEDKTLKSLQAFPHLVTDFVHEFLPEIADVVGSERIEPLPTVMVTADGHERRCDYAGGVRVPGDGPDEWLVLLVENQSTPDPHMLDRLIGYNRGLRNALAARSRYRAADGRTPPIVAVVFFTGSSEWRGATSTCDQSYSPAPVHSDNQGET